MKNIELKVEVADFKSLELKLKKIKATNQGVLNQVDSYYVCKNGRLKIREINKANAEIIFYQRPDKSKFKFSTYSILSLDKSQLKAAKSMLSVAFGERVVVAKKRKLWIFKNTRVHLDEVVYLGRFLEIETVLNGISEKEGRTEYSEIYDLLDLKKYKKIQKSYSDLLIRKKLG